MKRSQDYIDFVKELSADPDIHLFRMCIHAFSDYIGNDYLELIDLFINSPEMTVYEMCYQTSISYSTYYRRIVRIMSIYDRLKGFKEEIRDRNY